MVVVVAAAAAVAVAVAVVVVVVVVVVVLVVVVVNTNGLWVRQARGVRAAPRRRRHLPERARELVGVLDGLAAALAQVGHHGVDGIADEHRRAVGPRAEELGPPGEGSRRERGWEEEQQ